MVSLQSVQAQGGQDGQEQKQLLREVLERRWMSLWEREQAEIFMNILRESE